MRKLNKIFLILVITFLLTNIFNEVYAIPHTVIPETDTGGPVKSSSSSSIDPNDYKPTDLDTNQSTINMANRIIGAFQAIGSIVSVFALVLIGIKYMLGSVEEKAEYKQTMIFYIVGAILVFAISNISSMIYNFAITL